MKTFKQWIEDVSTEAPEVGEPRGANPKVTQKAANDVVNSALAKNPSFPTSVASAPNPTAKAKTIGDFTSDVLKNNKTAIKSAEINPDLISRTASDAVGFNYKGLFDKKGMKKRMKKK